MVYTYPLSINDNGAIVLDRAAMIRYVQGYANRNPTFHQGHFHDDDDDDIGSADGSSDNENLTGAEGDDELDSLPDLESHHSTGTADYRLPPIQLPPAETGSNEGYASDRTPSDFEVPFNDHPDILRRGLDLSDVDSHTTNSSPPPLVNRGGRDASSTTSNDDEDEGAPRPPARLRAPIISDEDSSTGPPQLRVRLPRFPVPSSVPSPEEMEDWGVDEIADYEGGFYNDSADEDSISQPYNFILHTESQGRGVSNGFLLIFPRQ